MDHKAKTVMRAIVELSHGDLKAFAIGVKGKLTRTGNPNEADFVDAIYEAALELWGDEDAKPAE